MIIDVKVCPKNLLDWSNMEDWDAGASAAPSEHTLTGASATVAREATIVKQGTYSAKLTRVGADASLYHDFPDYASYLGRRMTFGAWVYATVASRARISIYDGTTTTQSSYHTGGSSWEFLTVTANMSATASVIRVAGLVDTGNTSGYFDGGILVEGALTFLDLAQYLETWSPNRNLRITKYKVARRAGVLITTQDYDERMLSFNGKVYGATVTAARTAYDTLLQTLNDGEKDLYIHDDRFFRAYLSSENHDYIAASRVMKFSMKFTAQNPFTYFLQKLRSLNTISSSPTSFSITNNGTAYTKPHLQFVTSGADITSCTLENLTTGQVLTFTGTVSNPNTLKIDCEAATVLNNAVDEIGSFGGDFLKLVPGVNALKFTGSNCTLKVDYYERYL